MDQLRFTQVRRLTFQCFNSMNLFGVMCLAKRAKRQVDCCQLRRLGVHEVHGQEVDAMLVDVWY